jgi:translation initiation factor IF-3
LLYSQKKNVSKVRKNEDIISSKIRVISEEGEQLGVMSSIEGLKIAKDKDLDLVEVSSHSKPPVCKIMNFGSYLYQKKKDRKVVKKKFALKEIKFGIRISDHDFEVKVNKARIFLEKGHSVRVVLQFKGREYVHPEIGIRRIDKMVETLNDVSKQEFGNRNQGKNIVTEFRPLSKKEK